MNRRKFLAVLSGLAAALCVRIPGLSAETQKSPPPPVPAPMSALTIGHIVSAWESSRPGKPLAVRVVTDYATFISLIRQKWNSKHFIKGIEVEMIHHPARFDVRDGQRLDFPPEKARKEWVSAPFQDHILMDGDEVACVISSRRVDLPCESTHASSGAIHSPSLSLAAW